MGEPQINGEVPTSLFLSHLSSYPVVSHSITTIRSHPYGQKSFDVADQGYNKFAKPLLVYAKPLAPYAAKVDSLGNEGLNRVDGRFPILHEEPDAIRGRVASYYEVPFRVVGDRRKHLMDTYKMQRTRAGGDGYVAQGMAIFTTGLKATSEGLEWLSAYLVPEAAQQNGAPNAGGPRPQQQQQNGQKKVSS